MLQTTNLLIEKNLKLCHADVFENVLWFWSNLLGDQYLIDQNINIAESVIKETCFM